MTGFGVFFSFISKTNDKVFHVAVFLAKILFKRKNPKLESSGKI
jgi:hypothetical protein